MRLRPRRISIGRLNGRYPLTPPTYLSRSLQDALLLANEVSHLKAGFPLRCLQRLSDPNMATRLLLLAEQPVH